MHDSVAKRIIQAQKLLCPGRRIIHHTESRMAEYEGGNVTRLLQNWGAGDKQAVNELTPLVYRELRKLAAAYLRRERHDHTLQPTALVNEAWIRLIGQEHFESRNRSHFFAIAANLMRQILVNHARERRAAKRGGGGKVTRLLQNWGAGDKQAVNELTPLVYRELRKLAAAYLRRERHDHTLQPTALVNEAWIRLIGRS